MACPALAARPLPHDGASYNSSPSIKPRTNQRCKAMKQITTGAAAIGHEFAEFGRCAEELHRHPDAEGEVAAGVDRRQGEQIFAPDADELEDPDNGHRVGRQRQRHMAKCLEAIAAVDPGRIREVAR